MTMNGDFWFRIRVAFFAFAFFTGLGTPLWWYSNNDSLNSIAWIGIVLGFAFLPFYPLFIVFTVGIQAVSPWSDPTWTRPTHRKNFLVLGNPLLVLHFFAFLVASSGAGVILSFLWNGWMAVAYGIAVLCGSAMVLIGLELSMRVFRQKMREDT